jgi:hypothetical protein
VARSAGSWAWSKIWCNSWSSSDLTLVKREFNDVGVFGSKGCFAGVTLLRRALGSSGESGRPSCSAVQHRRDDIAGGGGYLAGELRIFEELLRFGAWPCGVVAKHRKGRQALTSQGG